MRVMALWVSCWKARYDSVTFEDMRQRATLSLLIIDYHWESFLHLEERESRHHHFPSFLSFHYERHYCHFLSCCHAIINYRLSREREVTLRRLLLITTASLSLRERDYAISNIYYRETSSLTIERRVQREKDITRVIIIISIYHEERCHEREREPRERESFQQKHFQRAEQRAVTSLTKRVREHL